MPKQKLARKPPARRGTQGQVQPRGPHDPEHQEGRKAEQPDRRKEAAKKEPVPVPAQKRSPV